ncbi:PorV/PorQ family protein [Candidatus Neomarinimicrobiota bacterium]
MKHIAYVALAFILSASGLAGQERTTTKTGTTAAQFLKIGVHARVMGMGEASVAHVSDISSVQWNPAGLSRHNVQEAVFTNTTWLAETDLLHFAGSLSFGAAGVLAFQITSLDYGDMPVTTEREENGTGEFFTAQDLSIGVAYARNLTNTFSLGAQFKLISQRIWNMNASTMAVDMGALFLTPLQGVRLGMSISNFGGKMKLAGRDTRFYSDPEPLLEGNNDQIPANFELSSWAIPLTFRVGLAGELIQTNVLRLSWAMDALHPSDNSEYVDVGTELALAERLFLRGGMRTLFAADQVGGLSLGVGLHQPFTPTFKIKVDYAWVDYAELLPVSMLSVTIQY